MNTRSLFAIKPIARLLADANADASSGHAMKRSLGLLDLVALGIGAIIGSGIFVITGEAAAAHAGPACYHLGPPRCIRAWARPM
jgi:basic amino acid/polyamine antiporter, APA family